MFVVPRHTLSREVIPKNENVFVSRGKGAETLSSAVAVKTTATAEESAPAPFPRLADENVFVFWEDVSAARGVAIEDQTVFVFRDDLSGLSSRTSHPHPEK